MSKLKNVIFKDKKQMDEIESKALTMLQLLINTGASFEDEEIALGIIEETLKDSEENNIVLGNVSKKTCFKCRSDKKDNGWLLCDKCQND